jgi:type II secretory pathway pseudopilin PulG
VTFIEVILAMVLLGLASATLASVVGFVRGLQRREDTQLACAELANRLILQYLADAKALPPRGLPIGYEADYYRWDLRVGRVDLELNEALQVAVQNAPGAASTVNNPLQIDNRVEKIVVTVWLSEDSGGAYARDQGAPQFSLARLADRANVNRNPDTIRRMQYGGTGALEDFVNTMMGNNEFGEGTEQQPRTPSGNQPPRGGGR